MASKSARKRRKRRPPPPAPESTASEASAAPVRTPVSRPRRAEEAGPPPAPWGSFPLVEIAVFVGLVMLILGFFVVDGDRGPVLIATGLALGSIGGLELTLREHFSGYRSHTMVLAGVPALIVLGLLFYLEPDRLSTLARAGIGLGVFVLFALLLSRAFAARSGGLRYRFTPLRGGRRGR
jgi:hypothetical protein